MLEGTRCFTSVRFRRMACHHSLYETLSCICSLRTLLSLSQTHPGFKSGGLCHLGAQQKQVYHGRKFNTIDQLKQASVLEWCTLSECFIDHSIGEWCKKTMVETLHAYWRLIFGYSELFSTAVTIIVIGVIASDALPAASSIGLLRTGFDFTMHSFL